MSINHLLSWLNQEAPHIHKFYSIELNWCFLTDVKGNRYKITGKTPLSDLKETVELINKIGQFKHLRKTYNPL